ncbi:MAG: tRNA pseudouridine(38-40) synthase TruA [Candidatus Omnitrophica bacterium]|nr:tRNA pseudouridine(38-40) synthase TruA [Candidatus Omnitrophota bacterium]
MKKHHKQRNIFLEIEYLGTNYFGFQIQNKKNSKEITVQEALEKAIRKIFKENIKLIYSSRTDRGVHAKAQAVNFTTSSSIPLKNIKPALNAMLACDIRVKRVKEVPLDFHARFQASSKIYRYLIFQAKEPSVFVKDFSWHIEQPLDIERMKKAAKKIIGKKDFSRFAKEPDKYASCVRQIIDIHIYKKSEFIYLDIEATGFLRNMARNIVSFLVELGRGRILLKDVSKIMKNDAGYHNFPAPAQGLCLLKVNYS